MIKKLLKKLLGKRCSFCGGIWGTHTIWCLEDIEKKEEKDYTVNVDIQVFAKDDEEAVRKVSNVITPSGLNYWLGDIRSEDKYGEVKLSKKGKNESICEGCGEPILEGQAVVKGENRHSVCS